MSALGPIWELIKLELKLEWRMKYALAGAVLYVLTTIFVLYTTLQNEQTIPWNALFWMVALFITVNAVTKSFSGAGTGDNLYLYQLSSANQVIIAKVIYNLVLVFGLLLLSFGAFSLFIENPIEKTNLFLLSILLGSIGFSLVLTFVSAISNKTKNNAVFMAILGFPLIIPIILGLIKLTENALEASPKDYLNDIAILAAIDIILLAVILILFPFLWKD